jgi:Xaa-Pro aminopeptidase
MVVTVEPGIYVANRGGVRIEDMVLVSERGARTLTSSRRTLIELQP